ESTTTTDIRPTIAEYESSWWIRSHVFFLQHVPKAPVIEHHSLFETYLSKLEKSRKRAHSSFRVLARERNEEYGDFLVEDELRLYLEDEEMMLLEQEKYIIEEQRFRVEEAKRMRLEEDKLLQIAELKKRLHEFMNSTHVKSILGKLTHGAMC
ncbi:hypothetical protein Tco_1239024, partial [Tanacetum coccineum]